MQSIDYKNNELYVEHVPVRAIADQVGTPCYIYSRATIENNWLTLDRAFTHLPHRICYAVKANSNIAILQVLSRLQSGFDIVSVGELERVLAAGGDPQKIIFSGVGKQKEEIIRALQANIFCFNIESDAELQRLNDLARDQRKIATISLRINPNIDARTHPYIATGLHENKFGIDIQNLLSLLHHIKTLPYLRLIGIGCHIGSQLTELDPFLEAIDCLLQLVDQLTAEGFTLKNINIGGGLGICYQQETPPTISEYAAAIQKKLERRALELILEPGRLIVGNAGILLTKVEYLKHTPHKNFAIVDAAMNDLMRPALYSAWQNIMPVVLNKNSLAESYDIVGPVCESADFLGKNRPLALNADDLLAVYSAGAYGFSMSSNYNSRPRVAEVLIDKDKIHLIRKRESIKDLFINEQLI